MNGEFNNVLNDYNGNITNANISASAAIATSKINATFPSGAIVGTTDSQTLTNKTINATQLVDASVTNRKIKLDKIQSVTSTTNLNTSSTSYVDYTGLSVTFTPDVASNVLVLLSITSRVAGVTAFKSFVVLLDGAIQGNDPLIISAEEDSTTSNWDITQSSFVWITGLSQASHTIKVQAKVNTGTLWTGYGQLTVIPFAS